MLKNPNHQDPQRILETVFGFDAFRPGQLSVIQHILERTHVLAVMPTGSGKSLCSRSPRWRPVKEPSLSLRLSP